jgi:hypothetical protein
LLTESIPSFIEFFDGLLSSGIVHLLPLSSGPFAVGASGTGEKLASALTPFDVLAPSGKLFSASRAHQFHGLHTRWASRQTLFCVPCFLAHGRTGIVSLRTAQLAAFQLVFGGFSATEIAFCHSNMPDY